MVPSGGADVDKKHLSNEGGPEGADGVPLYRSPDGHYRAWRPQRVHGWGEEVASVRRRVGMFMSGKATLAGVEYGRRD